MKALERLGLLVAACVITLGGAELITRWLGHAPPIVQVGPMGDDLYVLSDNPRLGYVMRSNFRGQGFRTNAAGFRGRALLPARTPGVARVVMLGDSVTVGTSLAHDVDTLAERLEQRLDRAEVGNLAIGGYCTYGEVELFRTVGVALRPDLVVVVFVENDYDSLNSEVGFVHDRAARRAAGWLWRSSHLARWAAWRLGAFEADAPARERRVREHMEHVGSGNVERGLALLAELSRREGFDVLVAIWPAFTASGIFDREPGRVVGPTELLTVETIARSHGLATLRLSDGFRRHWFHHGGGAADMLYARDGMHPTPLGARVAAEVLAPEVAKRLRVGTRVPN